MLVLVTGATGFLGRRVVRKLLERHHRVRCLVHVPGRERIFDHRTVEVHYGDISDSESLSQALYDVEAVVHLVAIIREGRRATFDRINRQGTSNLLAVAKAAGVREFQHVSAIGAANDRSYPYLYSKWQAEREVVNSGLLYTIFRPSIMFGEGDEFLTSLAGLVRLGPVVPVIGQGRNRMQPICADDVARCVAASVGNQDLRGRTLELGGPEQLSYNQLVDEVARAMGKRRLKFHIPTWAAYAAGALMGKLMPRAPITTGQIQMVRIRNVADGDDLKTTFGFTPRPLRGNIDYVKDVGFFDGLKLALGLSPRRSLRDH